MKKRGGKKMITLAENQRENVVNFREGKKKRSVSKTLLQYYNDIKPMHKQSEEYRKTSAYARKHEDEDWD